MAAWLPSRKSSLASEYPRVPGVTVGRLAGEGRCQGSLPCLTTTVTASLGCRLAEKVNQLTSERLQKTIPASIAVQPLIVPPSNARTQRPGCAMIIACANGHVQVSAH